MAKGGYTVSLDLSEWMSKLDNAETAAQKIGAQALYDGAKVMADAVAGAVDSIQTESYRFAPEGSTRLPSPEEKELLKGKGLGIAKFERTVDGVNTIIGFNDSGYGFIKGKRVPIDLIARSINSGTSFMNKQPFFRKACNKAKAPAESAMDATAAKAIDNILKEK